MKSTTCSSSALLGVGKSHLAQALGYELIKRGKTVLYRSVFDVVTELLELELENYAKTLKRYLKCDLLIIDDMGIKQLPLKSTEYLFEIVMRRYEIRSTLMTSNRPLEEWGKLLGDVPADTAILTAFSTTPRSSPSPAEAIVSRIDQRPCNRLHDAKN